MFHARQPKGTRRQMVRTGLAKEMRASRAWFLVFKGDDRDVVLSVAADYLDLLDSEGYGELCQTEHARNMVAL